MSPGDRVLTARLRTDLARCDVPVDRIDRAFAAPPASAQDLMLDAVALNLQDLYTALERLMELIARAVDGAPPSGPNWDRELLAQMAIEIPGVRPPVLREETIRTLDEYLRFRHGARDLNSFELDPEPVRLLGGKARAALDAAGADFGAFASYLEELQG